MEDFPDRLLGRSGSFCGGNELAQLLDERLGLRPSAETRAAYLRLLGPDD